MRHFVVVVVMLSLVGCAGYRAESWNNKGVDRSKANDYSGATAAYAEAIRLAPDVAKYHCNLANMLARRGYYEHAAMEYQTALKLDPAYRDASQGLEIVTRAADARRSSDLAVDIANQLTP